MMFLARAEKELGATPIVTKLTITTSKVAHREQQW